VIAIVDIFPECVEAQAKVHYKSKIRLYLKNIANSAVEIQGPDWLSTGDLGAQLPIPSSLQLQGPSWQNDDFQEETNRLYVRPGQVFRLLIGVELDATRSARDRTAELRTRMHEKRIGTVVLMLGGGGLPQRWSLRV
jgi:hypothetical protein